MSEPGYSFDKQSVDRIARVVRDAERRPTDLRPTQRPRSVQRKPPSSDWTSPSAAQAIAAATAKLRFVVPNVVANTEGWMTAGGGEQVESLTGDTGDEISGPVTVESSGGITTETEADASGRGGKLKIAGAGAPYQSYTAHFTYENTGAAKGTWYTMEMLDLIGPGAVSVALDAAKAGKITDISVVVLTASGAHDVGACNFRAIDVTNADTANSPTTPAVAVGASDSGSDATGVTIGAGEKFSVQVKHEDAANTYIFLYEVLVSFMIRLD